MGRVFTMTVAEFNTKLSGIDILKESQDAIEAVKEIIADLNIEQFKQGKRADGTFMPDYSPVSVSVYGKPEGPIRLYETGSFYSGITVKVEGKVIVLDSTDEKTPMLEKRYIKGSFSNEGGELFGLTDESKEELIPDLLPVLIDKIKSKL